MFESVAEAIAIGQRAHVPVDIIHLKIAEHEMWGQMPELTATIAAARERGQDVQANVYPYRAGQNNLASIIPPWAHEGGNAEMLKRLKDPAQRERLKKDIKEGIPGWYNHYTAIGGDWSRMLISGRGSLEGLSASTLRAALAEAGLATVSPDATVTELFQASGLVASRNEARRTVAEGGAYVNNERISDADGRDFTIA